MNKVAAFAGLLAAALTLHAGCAAAQGTPAPAKKLSRQDTCIYDGSLVEKIAFGRDSGISSADMRQAINDDLRREPGFSQFFRAHTTAVVSWVYQNPGLDKTSAMRSYYDDCMSRPPG